mmetsp:Transcript_12054/g.20596  ORF Transcript_12054/g.20596 Transcript_12054/m.20596 type:complete len:89 (+) Transcript_12054:204-470(+)
MDLSVVLGGMIDKLVSALIYLSSLDDHAVNHKPSSLGPSSEISSFSEAPLSATHSSIFDAIVEPKTERKSEQELECYAKRDCNLVFGT